MDNITQNKDIDALNFIHSMVMKHPFFAEKYKDDVINHLVELEEELDLFRICSSCGKPMIEGYCIEDGEAYYCSDECLYKHLSEEEFLSLYNNGKGNSYWTNWYEYAVK